MQLSGVLLMIVGLLSGMQSPSGSVVLSASRTNPYVGELIELRLLIRSTPSAKPLDLAIAGLTAEEAWRLSFGSWLQSSAAIPTNALRLKWHGKVLYAPLVQQGEYEFRWKELVRAPRDEENATRRIGPIQVGAMTSNTVVLEIQHPPLQSPSATIWGLGVGRFQVSAAWQPTEVVLGEETTLNITVEGSGALEAITPPSLRTLPGWESDRFLLEALPASWEHGKRLFRYLVRPRQLQATIPPLFIRFFDPERGITVTHTITIPPLIILAARQAGKLAAGSTVADAVRHLPDFRRSTLEHQEPDRWASWVNWLLWIPVIWSCLVVGRFALQRLAPAWLQARRWQQAERITRLRLNQTTPGATRDIRGILASYLSIGLSQRIPDDWESLTHHAPLAPRQIEPILNQIQRLEFGPEDEQAGGQLHTAVNEAFQSQEASS